MTLLTFLGTANYNKTTYTLDGKQHSTCYCPAAVAHFYRPPTTLVVVTQKAREMHFEALADEIGAVTRPVEVPIPDGHSEADLWQIFAALTQHVTEGDELVVDITNGFRSLPFLSFLAVAFLRLARRVKVQRILYGAYDAKNEANQTPIFDLTPFLTLLDWTIATDRFTRFGDATDLADLLKQGMPPGPLMRDNLEAREIGNGLKGAAKAMEDVSLALRLTRPLETMAASAALAAALKKAGPLVAQNAPPFALLARQVQQAYEPLAMANDMLAPPNWPENLQKQLDLVGRYLHQGQVVQAVTLAREWLVSVLLYHFKADSLVDHKSAREPVEFALSNQAERIRKMADPRPPLPTPYDDALQALPQATELGKLWDELTGLRNDIAHVGMNLDPSPAASLRKRAEGFYPRLQAVWAAFGTEPA
jgi:hypothetical protein